MKNTLSEAEERYIEYWEKNRLREKKLGNQLLVGLPIGILIGAPVLLNVFTSWYVRAGMLMNTHGNPTVILVAVLLIVSFVTVFYMKHRWEMKEQQYLEFLAKRDSFAAQSPEIKPENQDVPAAKPPD